MVYLKKIKKNAKGKIIHSEVSILKMSEVECLEMIRKIKDERKKKRR